MWFYFALLSGFLYTISGLITRFVLKGQKDAWAFSFYFSLIGALVSLPFLLKNPQFSHTIPLWGLMIVVGFLIVLQNFLNFTSSNSLEASISGALTKFRLVWTFLFGILLLHEVFSYQKLLGTALTILAGLVIVHKFKAPKSLKGVIFAFCATILYAVVILFYKYLFVGFNAVTLTFFIFFIPAVLNFFLMPKAFLRIKAIIRENFWGVTLACGFGAGANLALNQALSLGEVSRVLVIGEAFLILTLVGEHIFLKERENLWVKVAAVVFATLGAILIRMSS